MKHPFETLKQEYSQLLSVMVVRPECRERVNATAMRILSFRTRFEEVQKANGVPVLFSGPSFYREANLDFNDSPAQGDPWRRISVNVPKSRGPFKSWFDAAIDAYHINELDKVGAGNWTMELICYYAELFNGFGYRDFHHMHSPYLWGGTNIQSIGKYDADDKFVASEMDTQLGVIPLAKKLLEIAPELALGPTVIPPPISSGIDQSGANADWVQNALNSLGAELTVDSSFGKETRHALQRFQFAYHLMNKDGLPWPESIDALKNALAALDKKDAP